ncbi:MULTISPECIES: acyltransferase family protein [unclassified Sphingomonas]|uniref:acyltransferase family protein n=1 Tax=unclassified Sphingomonas TaxID=196159 RepID=UPI00082F489A|nr:MULTISPECIES: acyltransferase family protein [unclassified Sphingomonas]
MSEANLGQTHTGRHFGLDWLRIAAFALLIVYHIAMVFSPWPWVIHTDYNFAWLIAPMALLTPWRLPLLFAVSGFASWHLFARSRGPRAFFRARNLRLLVPLAFGMVVLIPIEMWVRVVAAGYPHGYLQFWTSDYWRIGDYWGRSFPSWEHLWFVVYLWAYTAVLALILWRGRHHYDALVARFVPWVAQGWRMVWVPAILLVIARLGLQFVVADEQGLLRDWAGHAHFFPLFLFGFVLAGSPILWPTLRRVWGGALALAAVSGVAVLVVETNYPGNTVPPHWVMAVARAGQVTMGWAMTLVLIQFADRFWNRDHRWRKTMAEAVFPFYLVHQPAIVLIAWHTLPLHLSAGVEFLVLLGGTALACTLTYLIGREIGWLRPLIGLGPRAPMAAAQRSPQIA